MNHLLPLPVDKKILVTYRVEPGCLGPEGKNNVDAFCAFALHKIQMIDADVTAWNDVVAWSVVPRNDKILPELQYDLVGKKISQVQAEKYFTLFNKSLDEFESVLADKLEVLISEFMRSREH